jgi:hypothetical protein
MGASDLFPGRNSVMPRPMQDYSYLRLEVARLRSKDRHESTVPRYLCRASDVEYAQPFLGADQIFNKSSSSASSLDTSVHLHGLTLAIK